MKSKDEMIEVFRGPIGYISNGERIFYIKQLCMDDEYRRILINGTEIIRKLSKKQLAILLPLIWKDEEIDHTRVSILFQIYKGKENTSDKIIKSLNIDEDIKEFYLKKYFDYMELVNSYTVLNKISCGTIQIPHKYLIDSGWGNIYK